MLLPMRAALGRKKDEEDGTKGRKEEKQGKGGRKGREQEKEGREGVREEGGRGKTF